MSNYLDRIIEEFITGPSSFKPQQSPAPQQADMLMQALMGQQPSPMGVGQVPSGMQQAQIVGGQPGPMGQVGQAVGMGGNAGDLLGATAAYQNTQNRRSAGVPGVAGGMAQFGEMISDAIREPEARRQLQIETDLAAAQAESEKNRQELLAAQQKKQRAAATYELTGDQSLADLAYEDDKVALEVVKSQLNEVDPSTMQKEWEFIQSQPEGPQKQMLLEKFMKQKETIMKAPLKFGYMYGPDGSIQLRPGEDNPVTIENRLKQQELAQAQFQTRVTQVQEMSKADNAIRQIERSLENVNPWSAGFGSLTSIVPGSPAADLKNMLDTQKASVAFAELKAMREASKTGGALGNVSNREIELLYNSFAGLSQEMSPQELRTSLNDILMRYEGVKYGLDNEDRYNLMMQEENLSPEQVTKMMIEDRNRYVNSQMAKRSGVPAEALEDFYKNPDTAAEFEKTFGWRPSA